MMTAFLVSLHVEICKLRIKYGPISGPILFTLIAFLSCNSEPPLQLSPGYNSSATDTPDACKEAMPPFPNYHAGLVCPLHTLQSFSQRMQELVPT